MLHAVAAAGVLTVSEIFGPTLQGEGPTAGRRAGFLRLGRCNLACSWCVAADTPVFMADRSVKAIADISIGDKVLSYRKRQYETAEVLAHTTRHVHETVLVRAGDSMVQCTPDHVFATPHQVDGRRRSTASQLEGRHVRSARFSAWEPDASVRTDEWWRGWCAGLIVGDGHVGRSASSPQDKVWLRVTDRELADALCAYVRRHGARCTVREAKRRTVSGKTVWSVAYSLARSPWILQLPTTTDGIRGWLAGFFDAEGSVGRGQATLTQYSPKTLDRAAQMLFGLGIAFHREDHVITLNGAQNVDRFMDLCRPVLDRKRLKQRMDDKRQLMAVRVEEVKPAGSATVHNLTTTSGFFFADGLLVEQCDTPYSWQWDQYDPSTELSERTADDVLAELDAMRIERLVITGGEPLLQQQRLVGLLQATASRHWQVEIETNGTIAPLLPKDLVTQWNVSPKLANSGMPLDRRYRPDVLRAFEATGRAVFKFVATDPSDLDDIQTIVDSCGLTEVWVMPEGTDSATVTERLVALAPGVIDRGWNLTPRLHILIWADRRGV